MEELKNILDSHRIGWQSPMVFLAKNEVITLSPELIFDRVFDLRLKDRKQLIDRFRSHQGSRNTMLNYLNKLGKCIVNAKL